MADRSRDTAPKWGPYCRKCGHPPSYHGATFCRTQAGSTSKRQCDCDGYEPHQRVPVAASKHNNQGPSDG